MHLAKIGQPVIMRYDIDIACDTVGQIRRGCKVPRGIGVVFRTRPVEYASHQSAIEQGGPTRIGLRQCLGGGMLMLAVHGGECNVPSHGLCD